eukprot:8797406-Karenia_brevis.AAC.1
MDRYTLHEAYWDTSQQEYAQSVFDDNGVNNGFAFRGLATHLLIDMFLCPNATCAQMLWRSQWG